MQFLLILTEPCIGDNWLQLYEPGGASGCGPVEIPVAHNESHSAILSIITSVVRIEEKTKRGFYKEAIPSY